MDIKAIDISGGVTTIQYKDGTRETFAIDGYEAMQNCRVADPKWNVPAASGKISDVEAFVAEVRRMAAV